MAIGNNDMIIRYAEDEMDAAERGQFEVRLRSEPDLRAELERYLEMKAVLQERLSPDDTGESLGQRLTRLNTEYFNTRPAVRRILPVRLIAAAVVFAVIAGIYLLRPNPDVRLDRLGQTTMPGNVERGGDKDTLLTAAASWFNKGDFARALPFLDNAVKKDSANQLALFYRGIAEWRTGSIEAARTDWIHIYNSASLLRYEAAFYLALSYAAGKDKAKALEWADRIPADAHLYSKAKELKDNL
jgi:hypothetical protein